MPSSLTRMLSGESSCHRLLEDGRFAAVLEPNPLTEGHALIFPKNEIDSPFDLDDEALAALAVFSKRVAAALKKAVPCTKIAVIVYGMKVRHAHLHLVPVSGNTGEIDLARERSVAPESALAQTAAHIRSFL
jgi:histidine triad (HIT) family protein